MSQSVSHGSLEFPDNQRKKRWRVYQASFRVVIYFNMKTLNIPVISKKSLKEEKMVFFGRILYGGSKIKTAHPEYKSLFSQLYFFGLIYFQQQKRVSWPNFSLHHLLYS